MLLRHLVVVSAFDSHSVSEFSTPNLACVSTQQKILSLLSIHFATELVNLVCNRLYQRATVMDF